MGGKCRDDASVQILVSDRPGVRRLSRLRAACLGHSNDLAGDQRSGIGDASCPCEGARGEDVAA